MFARALSERMIQSTLERGHDALFPRTLVDSQKEATREQKGAQRPALDTYKVEERRGSIPAPERRARKKR